MLRMLKGMAAGAVVGVAVTAIVLPQLDRKTQRKLKRVGKRALNMLEDASCMASGYINN